jgi:hypothetical protein
MCFIACEIPVDGDARKGAKRGFSSPHGVGSGHRGPPIFDATGTRAGDKTTTIMRSLTILSFCLLYLGAIHAQTDGTMTKGSMFEVRMVQTAAHSQEDYLQRLNTFYLPVMRKAQEQGLIKSYKVLAGTSSNEQDYDVMLLVEHAGMGYYDTDAARDAKWDAIEKEVVNAMGGSDKRAAFTEGLKGVRTYKGQKYMREMLIK